MSRSTIPKAIPPSGLTTLVDHDNPTLDVVFVHGFTGHPERTWTHKKGDARHHDVEDDEELAEPPSKARRLNLFSRPRQDRIDLNTTVYWPQDLLPVTVPNARVLTYGYDTHIRHKFGTPVNRSTVYDIAWDFLVALEANRRADATRPVIFVAHSLGGIIVKETLRRSSGCHLVQTHLRDIFDSTIGIVFLGTPHGGADPRGFLQLVAEKAIKAAGFHVNEQIVNTLLPSAERLRELKDEFSPIAHQQNWIIHSFQEQVGVQLLGGHKVVEDTSSYLNFPAIETTEHIGRNHMDMCRFTGIEDIEYRKVAAAILRITDTVSAKPKTEKSTSLSAEQKQSLLESLSFVQIDARQMTIKSAFGSTCLWMLNKSEYTDWLDGSKLNEHHGLLWIKGKPGAGKSTLMKVALSHSRHTRKGTVLISFFFNARGEELEKSTIGMYRSLLLQLLEQVPELLCTFDTLGLSIRQCSRAHQWSLESLKALFERAIQNLGRSSAICYVDALDECDEDEIRDMVSFFEHVGELAISSGVKFHVCFSSRHYPHITVSRGLSLVLEGQQGHKEDIANYVNKKLQIGRSKTAEWIRSELQERASGVFMWVVLVVEILNKEFDKGHIHALKKRFQVIPSDLNKLFHEILTRDHYNKDEMLLCIQWILFSRKPLTPEQLYFAVLSGIDPEDVIKWDACYHSMAAVHRFILSSSKGVAEITKSKTPTVQFIHESVRDFLLRENGLSEIWPNLREGFEGQSHEQLKKCCLNYLPVDTTRYFDLGGDLPKASSQEAAEIRQSTAKSFPFLEYAVRNVLYHANEAQSCGVAQNDFIQDFQVAHWVKLDNVIEKHEVRRHTTQSSLLYILAENNLSNLIRIHPSNLDYLRVEDERYGPPLFAALAIGSDEAVQVFLKARSAIEPPNHPSHDLYNRYCQSEKKRANFGRDFKFVKHRSLVSYVAEYGDEILLSFLLHTENLPFNSKDKSKRSPLMYAAVNGYEAVIEVLFGHGVDVNERGRLGTTPLCAAVVLGHVDTTKALILSGADVNAQGTNNNNALYEASSQGHIDIVKLLLDHNAVVNIKGEPYGNALQAASAGRAIEIVELLLSKGAEVNAQGGYYGNALQAASAGGTIAIVELLLSKGAEVNAQGGYYGNALQAASAGGTIAIVELLLSKGAEVNAQGGIYGNALQAASAGRAIEIVELLLSKGAEVNAQGGYYGNALQAASAGRAIEIVELLLSKGAEVNAQGGYYGNALQAASAGGTIAIVELLLSKGAEVNAQGGIYGNALQAAKSRGHDKVVKLLVDKERTG